MEAVEVFKSFLRENRGKFTSEDIKELYELRTFLDAVLLEALSYNSSGLDWMRKRLEKESVSNLIQSLARLGIELREELGKDFRKMGYRILEQIRSGSRKDVEYSIMRIFMSNGKTLPLQLVEVFKPRYDDEAFKACMYVFLGSVIKEKEVSDE